MTATRIGRSGGVTCRRTAGAVKVRLAADSSSGPLFDSSEEKLVSQAYSTRFDFRRSSLLAFSNSHLGQLGRKPRLNSTRV